MLNTINKEEIGRTVSKGIMYNEDWLLGKFILKCDLELKVLYEREGTIYLCGQMKVYDDFIFMCLDGTTRQIKFFIDSALKQYGCSCAEFELINQKKITLKKRQVNR